MSETTIGERVKALLASLPEEVLLVGAAKTRSADEVREAVQAGLRAVGHNYVQEAESMRQELAALERDSGARARWHLIGHLQRNKAKKAVELFDMIETLDSLRLARAVDRHCAEIGKTMPVLIEINSGRESSKTGVAPEQAEDLARALAALDHVRLEGLMTMGPRFGDPQEARLYFRVTKELFDHLSRLDLGDGRMRYLSMGMSNSYRVAIEEGANVVRIGTALFGERAS